MIINATWKHVGGFLWVVTCDEFIKAPPPAVSLEQLRDPPNNQHMILPDWTVCLQSSAPL